VGFTALFVELHTYATWQQTEWQNVFIQTLYLKNSFSVLA